MTSSLAVDRFAAKKDSLRSPRGRLVASLTRRENSSAVDFLWKGSFLSGEYSTYRNIVAICSVPVHSIREIRVVRHFTFGFRVFISRVTHGPSAIV